MKKVIMVLFATALLATSVFAAQPTLQSCFGYDIAGYAQNGETDANSFFEFGSGSGWGGFISGVATSPGADGRLGVGGEIQAHQAGIIPDEVISNSCND